MQRGLTGQYHVTQVAGETIRAFVPHPLPPNPPPVFDTQRQKLLARATLALDRLDSISLLLPDLSLM